jgi:hypothetical protein
MAGCFYLAIRNGVWVSGVRRCRVEKTTGCSHLAIRNGGCVSGDQEEVWSLRSWLIILPGDNRRGNMPVGIRRRCGDREGGGLLSVDTWYSGMGKYCRLLRV